MKGSDYIRPVRQGRLPPPEYKRSYKDIQKVATVGDYLKLSRRVLHYVPLHWEEHALEGIITEFSVNALVLNGTVIVPYYTITNWEVVNE